MTTPEPAEAPGGADRADPTFEMLPGDNPRWVVWVGTDHLTWEPGGELQPSDDCVTANRLKVGT